MILSRFSTRLLCVLLATTGTALGGQVEREDAVLFEKERPRRERPHDPERVQARIEELRAADPDDPRIPRLERLLARLTRGDGDQRERRDREPHTYTPEQVAAFVEQHPQLEALAERMRGRRRGGGRHLFKIMDAFNEGDTERGELLIRRATLFGETARLAREIREAAGDADRSAALRAELRPVVREQVEVEYELKGLELARLEERLAAQKAKHAAQATTLDELADRRMTRILDGHRGAGEDGPPRGKRRPRRPRPPAE